MLFRQKNKNEEYELRMQELEERLSKESEARQDAERELSMMNQTLHMGFRSISDFPNVMSSWVSRIHLDDIPAAMDGFNRLLEDMRGDRTFDEVYRIKHRDGQWHWYRNTATLTLRRYFQE